MGLVPLMFNVSEATFFAVPIAISLAFGVVFATAITLFVVPCGYLILDDLSGSLGRLLGRPPLSLPEPETAVS
jgi:Cu/Ag efflux pump CusA